MLSNPVDADYVEESSLIECLAVSEPSNLLYTTRFDNDISENVLISPKPPPVHFSTLPHQSNVHQTKRERSKFDIYFSNVHKRNPRSGLKKMHERIITKNSKNMHLLIPKSKRTQKQNNEQICAKLLGSKLNETSTSAEEVSTVISGAVGVPAIQISENERGEITDNRGYHFSSQD